MVVDLNLYKVFHTVACCKSISKAANELYISQPAVSKSIKSLESIVGVNLFFRNWSGVSLTSEGQVLFEYIDNAINQIQTGEKLLSRLKEKEFGSIKIGVSTTLFKHFLVPKLKKFINKYPNIKIIVINKTTVETLKLIENGDADIGIVSITENFPKYNFEKVGHIQDIFVASKTFIESSKIANPTDISLYNNFMFFEKDNLNRKYIDLYFEKNNISIKPDIEISNMDLLIELAKIDLGVTVAIKEFIQNDLSDGSLVELPIAPAIPSRPIVMLSNKNLPLSIASQAFWDYITVTHSDFNEEE